MNLVNSYVVNGSIIQKLPTTLSVTGQIDKVKVPILKIVTTSIESDKIFKRSFKQESNLLSYYID